MAICATEDWHRIRKKGTTTSYFMPVNHLKTNTLQTIPQNAEKAKLQRCKVTKN